MATDNTLYHLTKYEFIEGSGSIQEEFHTPPSFRELILYFIMGWLGAGLFCLFM